VEFVSTVCENRPSVQGNVKGKAFLRESTAFTAADFQEDYDLRIQ